MVIKKFDNADEARKNYKFDDNSPKKSGIDRDGNKWKIYDASTKSDHFASRFARKVAGTVITFFYKLLNAEASFRAKAWREGRKIEQIKVYENKTTSAANQIGTDSLGSPRITNQSTPLTTKEFTSVLEKARGKIPAPDLKEYDAIKLKILENFKSEVSPNFSEEARILMMGMDREALQESIKNAASRLEIDIKEPASLNAPPRTKERAAALLGEFFINR